MFFAICYPSNTFCGPIYGEDICHNEQSYSCSSSSSCSIGVRIVIGLFDTEEDMRQGDADLKAMDRPADAQGDIRAIEFYEVTADRRAEGQ